MSRPSTSTSAPGGWPPTKLSSAADDANYAPGPVSGPFQAPGVAPQWPPSNRPNIELLSSLPAKAIPLKLMLRHLTLVLYDGSRPDGSPLEFKRLAYSRNPDFILPEGRLVPSKSWEPKHINAKVISDWLVDGKQNENQRIEVCMPAFPGHPMPITNTADIVTVLQHAFEDGGYILKGPDPPELAFRLVSPQASPASSGRMSVLPFRFAHMSSVTGNDDSVGGESEDRI